ncbi:hypothetical protein HBO10_29345 [Pseudomonas sp. WS 5503]|uniref:hypothetical protein n=1 Tax=Pseudomonas sp. WS 5503 TaxID=2717497 RepID=UPI001475BCB7|nr:hypothetical protein [Pseudomonas sp. WS 5503]NMX83612.1 hypothetical protein [Pseudomonas sp. WS 5503]
MLYSRFLHTELESSCTADDKVLSYTIFSSSQPHTPALGFRKSVGLQRFAVIWDQEQDLRIISLIEEALAVRFFSPIKLLRLSKERLDIIVDQNLNDEKLKAFVFAWEKLIRKVAGSDWSLVVFTETQVHSPLDEIGMLDMFNQELMQRAKLGIEDYSPDLALL